MQGKTNSSSTAVVDHALHCSTGSSRICCLHQRCARLKAIWARRQCRSGLTSSKSGAVEKFVKSAAALLLTWTPQPHLLGILMIADQRQYGWKHQDGQWWTAQEKQQTGETCGG